MVLEVKRYSEAFQKEWDDFVSASVNGTFMQERKFLNYHPRSRFLDHSLIFRESNKIIGALPAAEIENQGKKILISHPGASHGGLIIEHTLSTKKSLELVKTFLKYGGEAGFNIIRLKLIPRIYHHDLADQIEFALRFAGFQIEYTELSTALKLNSNQQPLLKNVMKSTAFRSYQKAFKYGLRATEEGDLAAYWPVLERKLKASHNATPTHTLEEIQLLKILFPEKIKLFAAYHESQMVAGVLVFLLNKRVINCFYIAHDDSFQKMRPLNLVFGYLIEWGYKHQFRYLDWGISTESKGSIINNDLFRFKENFGGHGVLRESYIYTFK